MPESTAEKTDAEIYADVGKRRWPYVDEPRPTPGASMSRRRRPDAGSMPASRDPQPRPLAPAMQEEPL